jgi:phosphotransferase system HPr-like phosphotransfer protein
MRHAADFWLSKIQHGTDLAQAYPTLRDLSYWGFSILLIVAGVGAWILWKWRARVGRRLGIYQEVTEQMTVTDPHGFHMRRIKDLILVTRKHVTYRVFVRPRSAGGTSWADARSILRLQALGVRGPREGEDPPVVEVRVDGFRPRRVLQEIRKVLEDEPNKYLSVYELDELAKRTGGRVVAPPPRETRPSPSHRIAQWKAIMISWAGARLNLKAGTRRAVLGNPGGAQEVKPKDIG